MTTNSFTKICLFLFIGMTVAIRPAFSNPVSRSQALQNARNFIQKRGGNIKKMALRQAPLKSNEAENAPYYIFNLGDDNGFVIASGDDRAHAILGYSDEGAIDVNKMPDAMKYMLDYYEEQIQLSKNLTNSEVTNSSVSYPAVEPMLTTKWDQRYPYNANCPMIDNYRCATGCVATAMAQVMYYHHWPQDATAIIPSYNSEIAVSGHSAYKTTVATLPSTTFDWDNMLDTYADGSTALADTAVARLMQYCGAAVKMQYSPTRSGAQNTDCIAAFNNYFGYAGTITELERDCCQPGTWDELIYHEISQARPVIISGGANNGFHSFVCDGFDGDCMFHINWGW
ncbi:MAG: C10 family peptidase, partial [Prevotella sp.]|nr:C10 family peptidase [Prevotella sp.]